MIVQNNRGKITIDELIARGLILPEDGAVLRAEAFKNRFRKIDGVVGFFTVRRGQEIVYTGATENLGRYLLSHMDNDNKANAIVWDKIRGMKDANIDAYPTNNIYEARMYSAYLKEQHKPELNMLLQNLE